MGDVLLRAKYAPEPGTFESKDVPMKSVGLFRHSVEYSVLGGAANTRRERFSPQEVE